MKALRPLLAGLAAAGAVAFAPASAAAACTPAAPAFTASTFAARPVLMTGPASPRAVVYLFHGTGGSESFARRRETTCATAPLLAKGYLLVASQSGQREPARWSHDGAAESNPDVAYMLSLHRSLIAQGRISATTPVYTLGMSNGGGFANVFAVAARRAGVKVAGIADYMGPIPAAATPKAGEPVELAPLFLVLSANDGYVNTPRIRANAEALAARGLKVEMHLSEPHPVTAASLAALTDLPADKAGAVVKDLTAAGVLDAAGKVVVTGPLDRDAVAALDARLPASAKGRDILNALVISAAGHQMRSDYAEAGAAFFEAVRP